MVDRDCTKNAGFLSLNDLPEDVYVLGAVIVTMDEDGNYGLAYRSESFDNVPIPEVQESLSPLIIQAWQLANNPGIIA